ncbi:UvrD-helicase domain-containing protein [Achromobacter xylosoxidans]|uniref:UvrD-helicase domain-containing protein n=1 Tax=Achromobacter TaxID=222 RepID=UPI0009F4126D|nr:MULTISPECIES: UvrD-helicase domain-containing protein [Achromobacter]MCH4579938.1 UvrD-helicase domain-containing protein [Achromobacter xylosoxidans]PWY42765.1 ATP-dependent helicase [Achromobacter sp. RW408]
MPDAVDLFALGNAAVVAPAGHGKTEIIANVAALGGRALILTHTHAGVHAIRARIKRLGVPHSLVTVDTIAGWCMRYAHAFPGAAQPPDGLPQTGEQWNQLYRGATATLGVKAVREVIAASYDRILIDEYQDCHSLQHQLAVALSGIVPTLIFGDPMQGIFEFAGATLSWSDDIHHGFPFAGTLETPHRWVGKNPELGQWIAETRLKLMRGEVIDLSDPRISYRESDDAFDMGTLFEGIDGKDGSFAAIHCNKTICYRLAKAANGGYQAIEEIAANRLRDFASAWDRAADGTGRLRSFTSLIEDCFHKKPVVEDELPDPEDTALQQAMRDLVPTLAQGSGAEAVTQMFGLARKRPRWKLYRNELWRDAERAATEVSAGRAETMTAATLSIRQRVSNSGRRLPKRTVSTPLLLKGLEFDHVVIPDASHFANERQAQAKLFYVAISRATQSLTISSPARFIQLPVPNV